MVGGDGVDGAVGEGGDDGLAVGLGAERRGELGKGAVVADGGLVQVEVGRGGVAGNGEAFPLGPPDEVERGMYAGRSDPMGPTARRRLRTDRAAGVARKEPAATARAETHKEVSP